MFGRSTYQPKHALPVSHSTERRSTFMVLLAMLLSSGLVVGTSASFDASNTEDASRFAMATLERPTNLQGEMAGTAAALQWLEAGVPPDGAILGYRISWADGGAPQATGVQNGSCTDLTYTPIFDASGSPENDPSANTRFTDPAPQGRWACYKAQTVYPYPATADPWLSQLGNPLKAIQTGFVTATVTMTNGGTNFQMGSGDVITITFNQPVSTASGPAEGTSAATGSAPRICSIHTNGAEEILIGAMGNHNTLCATSETVLVGRLTPAADRIDRNVRFTTTWAWSSCPVAGACKVLTATLGAKVNPAAPQLPSLGAHAAWTFTPATTLTSATGSLAMCAVNPTGGLCRPQTTGGW